MIYEINLLDIKKGEISVYFTTYFHAETLKEAKTNAAAFIRITIGSDRSFHTDDHKDLRHTLLPLINVEWVKEVEGEGVDLHIFQASVKVEEMPRQIKLMGWLEEEMPSPQIKERPLLEILKVFDPPESV